MQLSKGVCTTKYSGFRRGLNEIFALLDVTQRGLMVTDVSGQTIGPIFKGQSNQAVLVLFEPEDGKMSINVGK